MRIREGKYLVNSKVCVGENSVKNGYILWIYIPNPNIITGPVFVRKVNSITILKVIKN